MELNEQGELPREYFTYIEQELNTQRHNYNRNARYADGHNPSIMDATPKDAPDNRVPSGYAKKITDTLLGYMGKVGNITYSSEPQEYIDFVKENILDENDEELLTHEVLAESMTAGASFMLFRAVDNDGVKIKMYSVTPDTGVAIYDNTLDKSIAAFAHFTSYRKMVANNIETVYVMTIYYDTFFVEYQRGGSSKPWEETDRKNHPFGLVPAVKFTIGRNELPVFDAVIALIDEHDKIISSSYADERERFANSYLLLLKKISRVVGDDGLSDADKIKDLRMFDGLGDDGTILNAANAAAFLTKPSRGGDTAEAADRMEKLIYEISQVIDPSNKDFGTLSGIALAYKILPMEWLCSVIEAYFSKGIQRMFTLIGNAVSALYRTQIAPVTIRFRRNLPFDLATIATVAGQLKGILSDETILKLFPADLIPDMAAELERIDGQAHDRLPAIEVADDSSNAD